MNELSNYVKSLSRTESVWGIALIIMGMLAMVMPMLAGIGVTTLVSVLFIAAGFVKLVLAFKAEKFVSGVLQLIFGFLIMVCGGILLTSPLISLSSLTIAVAGYFIFDGIFTVTQSVKMRHMKGWGWTLVSGIASLVLAGLIGYNWPVSSIYTIGSIMGVRLVFSGISMLTVGVAGEGIADVLLTQPQENTTPDAKEKSEVTA